MKMRYRAVGAALWMACAGAAQGADRLWNNVLGGAYSNGANWTGGIVPGLADNAVFNLNAAGYTVSFNSNTSTGGMIVRTDDVTLNLLGFTYTLSTASPGLMLGDQSSTHGRLTIRSGTVTTSNATLGAGGTTIASIGAATITTGGTLSVGNTLTIGSSNFGVLNVVSGGRLTSSFVQLGGNASGSGSITVSGAGSAWTSTVRADVGAFGSGTARVLSGGTAGFDSLVLALAPGSSGAMDIDGTGSAVAITNSLGTGFIGSQGNGTVSVSTNAILSGPAFTLGAVGTARGVVSISSGGSFNCAGETVVGGNGHGELTVHLGGRAASNSLVIAGFNPAATGQVVVADANSFVNIAGSTHVGSSGAGTLHVNFSTFTTGSATVGTGSLSRGRLIVDSAGSFTSNGALTIGGFGSGSLTIDTDARARAASMIVGNGSTGAGDVAVSGTLSNLSVTGAAVIGDSGAGSVSVNAAADVGSATLTIGRFPSGRGSINVSGTGSSWTATVTTVGQQGIGDVHITSGGTLASSTARIGAEPGSSGAVHVAGNGARWTTSGNVFIGGGSISSGGSGLVEIGPGGNVQVNSLMRLYPTGVINLNGGTLSIGTLDNQAGQLNFNAGTLHFSAPVTGMTIDPGGPLGSILELRNNQNLVVNATLSIGFNGQLTIDGGRVFAAAINNTSDLVLRSPTSHLTATVFNSGQLRGQGSIFGNVNNVASGQLRASAGETLRILGVLTNNASARVDIHGGILQPAGMDNAGQVFLDGGLLDIPASLTNQSTGRISGRGRIITGSNFINAGTLNLTGGITDIEGAGGSFSNSASGRVIITGNSTTSFFKPVINAPGSEVRVSSGATGVFFEPVSGLDAFTGSGTVIFESTASLGVMNRIGTTVVGASGSLTAGHVRENVLEVNGQASVLPNGSAAGTSRLQQLLIAGELAPLARLDLSDNDLVIDYTGASPLLTIATQLRAAYAGGAWTGPGIGSSAAAATVNFALGFAEASAIFGSFPATFSGQLVDNTSLLIAYTRYGDANLDGVVNLGDFNRLASNFGSAGATWSQGDFNYDGIVNLSDFNRLAANFGLTASPDGPTPQDWSNLAAAVPEPSGLGVMCITLGIASRRLRRVAPSRGSSFTTEVCSFPSGRYLLWRDAPHLLGEEQCTTAHRWRAAVD